jgi:hypothetical protein
MLLPYCVGRSWIVRGGVVVLVAALGGVTPAFAQNPTLGEIAKKEQERRKTKTTTATPKVLTNKDLPPSAQQPQPPPPAAAAAPAAEQKPAEGQKPAGEPEKDETWWKQRITQVRETLRRNEAFAEALQSRVNALSADFVNRDDPFQRAKIGEDRQKALMEMERVKAEIVQNKKQIEDIEEEARKAGVPPGWLR